MENFKRFILILTITLSAFSCSKDDNDKVSGNKYETTYAKIIATVDGVNHTIEYETIADLKKNNLYLKADFRIDNTFWIYGVSGLGDKIDPKINPIYKWFETGTWTQKNSNITIKTDKQTLTAKVDGNKLIMIVNLADIAIKKIGLEEKTVAQGSLEWHFTKI